MYIGLLEGGGRSKYVPLFISTSYILITFFKAMQCHEIFWVRRSIVRMVPFSVYFVLFNECTAHIFLLRHAAHFTSCVVAYLITFLRARNAIIFKHYYKRCISASRTMTLRFWYFRIENFQRDIFQINVYISLERNTVKEMLMMYLTPFSLCTSLHIFFFVLFICIEHGSMIWGLMP